VLLPLAKLLGLGVVALILIPAVVLAAWSLFPYQPDNRNLADLSQDARFKLGTYDRYVSLEPLTDTQVGLVFFPGGVIDAQAYLYRLSVAAEAGVTVFVVQPPLHLAVTDPWAFDYIRRQHPEISEWYIGGHSLGGIVACWYANQRPDQLTGLLLMASYCLDDISQASLKVLSLTGDQDQLIGLDVEQQYAGNLPPSAQSVVLADFDH